MAKKLKIEIDLSGAAFEHNPEEEVPRILRGVWNGQIDRLLRDGGESYVQLRDINGNICGRVWTEEND